MSLTDKVIHKLVSKRSFRYYPEDRYLILKILGSFKERNVKVLDVGCGIGHYSFLFEKYGADVIAFDCDKGIIKKANEKKKDLNSKIDLLLADGRSPERYLQGKFDIIFMSGFSLFGINLDRRVMENYISLLKPDGKIIFIHNSNLTGVVRKTHWRNHKIDELKSFFEILDCKVIKIYFYDRHIIIKGLKFLVFNKAFTNVQIILSKITKLPCSLVFVVEKKG